MTRRARFRMRKSSSDDPAACLQSLAIRLHQNPGRINVQDSFRIPRRSPIRLHADADILQLDLIIGCVGNFVIDGATIAIRGTTAPALYPGMMHGHELFPAGAEHGERLVIKLRVDPAWPAVRQRVFEPVAFPVQGELMLMRALRRATRLSGLRAAPGVLHAARVVEVLCLWPGAAQSLK